jgi:hypothetical protein
MHPAKFPATLALHRRKRKSARDDNVLAFQLSEHFHSDSSGEDSLLTLLDDKSDPIIPASDSTLCGVYGIDSRYMKRAALYARVSGDLQAKEGTIESQVLALKKQIAAAGHVLAKEYIDNGFSGPRFDRPALNEMRKDVKTDVFDVNLFPRCRPHRP